MDFERIQEETWNAHLREMATRWHPSDEGGKWPMWVKIGSGVHDDGRAEHGVPHAHFKSKDGKEEGVFSIGADAPPGDESGIVVIEGKISSNWRKILVEWANSPAKINRKEIGPTMWEQAKDDWEVNRAWTNRRTSGR